MAKDIILKNAIEHPINIKSLGLLIGVGDDAVCGFEDILLLENSEELEQLILDGDIVVNNGVNDLSPQDALDYLSIGSDYINTTYTKEETDDIINNILVNNIQAIEQDLTNYTTVSDVDTRIAQVSGGGIRGSVNYFNELPVDINTGDVFIVRYPSGQGIDAVKFVPDGQTGLYLPNDVSWEDDLGHPGTLYGNAQLNDEAKILKSLYLNGTDQYVIFDSSSDFGEGYQLTVAGWIKSERTGTYGIIGRWNGEAGWKMEVYGNKLRVCMKTNERFGVDIKSPTNLPINQPVHIAFSYDGQNLILFINAIPINSVQVSGSITSSDLNLLVGKYASIDGDDNPDKLFKGWMDEVFVENRAMSQDELERLIFTELLEYHDEGFYRWNDSEWEFLARNTGENSTQSHDDLLNLNNGDYQHITSDEKTELTTGVDTELHNHNSLYYTKSESSLNFSKSNHNHNTIYYNKPEIDNLINSLNFSNISANDPSTNITGAELEILTNGGNADGLHTHSNSGVSDLSGNGLDDAYDNHSNWQPGVGRTIYVDQGSVTLQALNGFAPLKLTSINYKPNQSLSGGELCVYNNELFLFDSERNKWLSTAGYTITGGSNANNIKNSYLRGFGNVSFTSDIGWVAHWPGTIISLAIACGSEGCSNSIQVRKNGLSIYSLSYSNQKKQSVDNINVDFNGGDVLNFYIDGNDNKCDRPQVWAIIKKRIV